MKAHSNLKLLTRRAAAYMLEMVPVQLLSAAVAGPFVAAAIHREGPWTEAEGNAIGARTAMTVGACVALGWFLLRDTVPGLSWGKLLMGVRVVHADGASPARLWQRALRNVLLAVPFLDFVEGLILTTTSGASQGGRRLGDFIARTRVVPRNDSWDPEWRDRDGALLLVAMALLVGAIIAGRYITEAVFWRYY